MTSATTPADPHAWLDEHIAEQAAFYGLTPEKKAEIFKAAAEYDEELLANGHDMSPRP